MAKFMLLMHDRPEVFEKMSPSEMQEVVQRYITWGRGLRASKIGGHKLTGDGRVIRRKRGKVLVTDGPFAESKEVLGGFFLVKARNYDEAVKLTDGCPHLDYGGTIEVRQIDGR